MTARKPNHRQANLPYAAADAHHEENLSLLRRLPGISQKGRDLLVWVANIEFRTGNPLRRTYEALGEPIHGLRCSRRTAHRVVSDLREAGFLTVTTVKRSIGQLPNEYRIDWDGVRKALFGQKPECQNGKAGVPFCQSRSAILSKPECQDGTHNKEIQSLIPILRTLPSSPTNAQSPKAATAADDFLKVKPEDFDALVGLVANCGVDRCFDVVSKAIARGDDVRAIVEAWRSRAKGWKRPAAKLALRLRDGRPGCTPDQGWPELDFPEKVLPRPTATPTRPANASGGETNKESTARREAILGAILDAMSIDSRLALLTESEITVLGKAVSRGGARNFLLERLEGRQGATKQVETRAGCISPGNMGAGRSAEHFAGSRFSANERGPPAMEEMRFARSDPSGSPAVA